MYMLRHHFEVIFICNVKNIIIWITANPLCVPQLTYIQRLGLNTLK